MCHFFFYYFFLFSSDNLLNFLFLFFKRSDKLTDLNSPQTETCSSSNAPTASTCCSLSLCPVLCLSGSSLQEHGPLSGQSVHQTHLLRSGKTGLGLPVFQMCVCLCVYPSLKYVCVSICQVSVPKDLVAVMSAMRDGQEVDPQDNSRVVFRFRQPVSVCVLRQ